MSDRMRYLDDTIRPEIRNPRKPTIQDLIDKFGILENTNKVQRLNPADAIDAAFAALPAAVPEPTGKSAALLGGIAAAGVLPMGRRLVRLSPNPELEEEPGRHGYLYFGATPRSSYSAAMNQPKFANFFRTTKPLDIFHPLDLDLKADPTGNTTFRSKLLDIYNKETNDYYNEKLSKMDERIPSHFSAVESPDFRQMLLDNNYQGSLVQDESGTSLALLPHAFKTALKQTGSANLEAFKERRFKKDPHYPIGEPYLDEHGNHIVDWANRQESYKFLQDLEDLITGMKMVPKVKRYREIAHDDPMFEHYPYGSVKMKLLGGE